MRFVREPHANASQFKDMFFIDALHVSNWDRELFEELRAGDLMCVHVTCAIWEDTGEALQDLGRWNRKFQEHADLILPVRSGADLEFAKAKGRTGIILGFQNTSPIEDKFAFVELFHTLGVKIMQLTYNNQNLIGGSCYEPSDSGLSRFGQLIVREMNRLGMIIDLSHVGERTSLDAIEASSRPVAITHANPYSFCAHPRNKSDKVLKALAVNGGVLGCAIIPDLSGGSEVALSSWCEMIARTVDLMGIDHIGIGSDSVRKCTDETIAWMRMGRWSPVMDYDPGPAVWHRWPEWFQTPADFPNLAAGLLKQGFHRDEVAAIMGGNWLRFFSEGFKPLQ